ncbi:SusC/RagA family TonB-linked outer membrane protein [Adhaeribacter aerolatus]|uniref:SusC/RagA family TonB-linked outer membrane protein n=1 Tax=Adhaeribacter aerolatus TaxID=670289 RepID=A0A512AZQ0_9BACT|nr:TonB-dependent receptor [Adhaeribacter aerolatus]GEO05191.1 SusC/RagA family TonB-linked outer membrane protein [Adhaeribacter aerolatus]
MTTYLKKISLLWLSLQLLLLPHTTPAQKIVLAQEFKTTPKSEKAKQLVHVLNEIKARYKISFLFEDKILEGKVIQSEIKYSENVEDLLNKLLPPLNLKYKKIAAGIFIISGNNALNGHLENRVINYLKLADITLTGKVTDAVGGANLPGVTVVLKGTTTGTVTNSEGNYSLEIPENAANGTLVFSFIGFNAQEVAIGNRSVINVSLAADTKALDEVVVIGYGTLRSQDVTGAVATVDQKTLKTLPVATIDQKLIGQVAGVQIQQLSGTPGGGTSVKIRGNGSLGAGNEPLYVVDGMPYSAGMNQNTNPLVFLNPNDIESVTVLKDASSTAIYGSRGANGVILITTKKGATDRTEVSVSSMQGVQQVPHKGRPELLNLREFAELQRDKIDVTVRRLENRTATVADYPAEYQNLDNLSGNGTDWYDLLLQTAAIQDHNVSLLRGTKDSRLNFSLGYFKQEGTLRYTGVERFSGKMGIESNIGKAILVGASLQPSYIQQDRTATNTNREDVLGTAIWANPFTTPYDENGQLKPYITSPQSKYHSAWSFANPLFVLKETVQQQANFQNLGSAFVQFTIRKDFKAKTSLFTNWSTSKFFQYVPSTVGAANKPPVAGTGRSVNNRGESFDWLVENTLTYDKAFGKHQVTALLGYTTQKLSASSINLNADPFANDLIQTINAAQSIKTWGQGTNEWSMISYLGRVNYGFNERYLLTATFRSDGSSRFGINNRYALFPSVAAAWRISEESFLQDNAFIENLKLRASYGKSGNNNIGNYAHLAAITPGAYIFGNTQVTASSVGLPNPNLTWEESKQLDAGLDLDVLDGRLSVVVDLYTRESQNMLLDDIIPAITGFNTQTVNKGSVRNRGLELGIGGMPLDGALAWTTNFNLAFNRNKVLSLNDNGDRILAGSNDNNPTHISVVGKPIGQFFGYIYDGLYTPEDMANPDIIKTAQVYEGNVKYRDINGDGIITDLLDYTIIGNPHPNFTFGFTNNFSYKGLSLGVVVNGQSGGQVMNGLRQTVDNLQGFFNVNKEWANRWRNPDIPGDGMHYGVPKLTPSLGHRVSNLWVEDASYLRIANVTLGYSLPEKWVEYTRVVKNCRLYATIQNLAMFTRYGGANPEGQSVNINNTLAPGFDMTSYPLARTTSVGINLTF